MNNSKTWVSLQLGEVCKLRGGVAFKPALQGRNQGEFPFIKVSDFNLSGNEVSINGANNWVDAADSSIIQGQPFPAGATVFAKIGEALKHNRKRFLTRPTYIDNNLMAAVAKLDVMLPEFLFQLFRTIDIAASDVGTAVPYVKASTLEKIAVVIPPIEIQRRIASILGAYDDLIEVNRRRIAVLEEMARRLFEEWFVHFRFPGHQTVGIEDISSDLLPAGWELETLGTLADIQWGDTSTTKKSYTPNGYRAYSASGPDGFMPKFDYDRLGIVLSAIGAQCGKTWLARGQWSCIKNTMRFWARASGVGTEYLYLALSDPKRWPKRGAAQPFISLGDARKIKIIQPDKNTSTRFEVYVAPMLELADTLSLQNDSLVVSRDLLLPRLISGQLSVAQAARELEAA
ncbi:restriction endonuclease subunit S [Gluconobacter aidae]|uniref:Type I restriction modification DNA specificity domain-containing protein n=1 Tax=Gluconobacter aidae TaxID=2662454 RepID=A0A7X1VNT3_9PROT|nr:restriction endonuclease subunit S [Gluconobacter aidae]MQS00124.1 hypothetical protein [Gluconobacter aidae]